MMKALLVRPIINKAWALDRCCVARQSNFKSTLEKFFVFIGSHALPRCALLIAISWVIEQA